MSDRYPWAAEVLSLLDAPPESVATGSGAWTSTHGGRHVVVRRVGQGLPSVHIETVGLWLTVYDAADVPTAVRALLAGLRATGAALAGTPEPGTVWFVRTEHDGLEEFNFESDAIEAFDQEVDAAQQECASDGEWGLEVESIALWRGVPLRRARLDSMMIEDEDEPSGEREVFDLRVDVTP